MENTSSLGKRRQRQAEKAKERAKKQRRLEQQLICQSFSAVKEDTASVLELEFAAVYCSARRKYRTTWSRLRSLVLEVKDPLALAILAIGYREDWFSNDESGYDCLGVGKRKSDEYGYQCLSWLRTQQNMISWFCLGQFFSFGIFVEQDDIEAIRYWRMANESGCVLSQVCIGRCYAKGNGVTKNSKEAIKWMRLASDQGHPEAQIALGAWYFCGLDDIRKDFQEGIRWLRMAADSGDRQGQFLLGTAFHSGSPPQDEDEDYAYNIGRCLIIKLLMNGNID